VNRGGDVAVDEDRFLQVLMWLVERGAAEVPITISVGGTFLRGDLVPQEEFFEKATTKIVVNDTPQEDRIRQILADVPGFLEEMLEQQEGESTEEEVSRELEDEFRKLEELGKARRRKQALESSLHLKNVEVLSGGAWVDCGDVFWRGQIAAVDGFWVGRTTEA
jgi:hypothetical protein